MRAAITGILISLASAAVDVAFAAPVTTYAQLHTLIDDGCATPEGTVIEIGGDLTAAGQPAADEHIVCTKEFTIQLADGVSGATIDLNSNAYIEFRDNITMVGSIGIRDSSEGRDCVRVYSDAGASITASFTNITFREGDGCGLNFYTNNAGTITATVTNCTAHHNGTAGDQGSDGFAMHMTTGALRGGLYNCTFTDCDAYSNLDDGISPHGESGVTNAHVCTVSGGNYYLNTGGQLVSGISPGLTWNIDGVTAYDATSNGDVILAYQSAVGTIQNCTFTSYRDLSAGSEAPKLLQIEGTPTGSIIFKNCTFTHDATGFDGDQYTLFAEMGQYTGGAGYPLARVCYFYDCTFRYTGSKAFGGASNDYPFYLYRGTNYFRRCVFDLDAVSAVAVVAAVGASSNAKAHFQGCLFTTSADNGIYYLSGAGGGSLEHNTFYTVANATGFVMRTIDDNVDVRGNIFAAPGSGSNWAIGLRFTNPTTGYTNNANSGVNLFHNVTTPVNAGSPKTGDVNGQAPQFVSAPTNMRLATAGPAAWLDSTTSWRISGLTTAAMNGSVIRTPSIGEYTTDAFAYGRSTIDSGCYCNVAETLYLTALSNAGYGFTGWSGSSTSKDQRILITLSADKAFTASFSSETVNGAGVFSRNNIGRTLTGLKCLTFATDTIYGNKVLSAD